MYTQKRKEKMENNLNIYQRMAMITAELQTVNKNLNVGTGKSTYKAVSERDVLDAVKPLEKKYGIYSYATDRKVIDSGEITSTKKDYQSNERYEAKQLYLRIEVTYRFVNIDNPGEYIEIKSYGDGIDSGDKATGKAMTYADKYALLKAYKISTGDDPDQEESGELKSFKKQAPKKSNKEKLIAYCRANNLILSDVARQYGLNGQVSEERFAEVLKEMGAE